LLSEKIKNKKSKFLKNKFGGKEKEKGGAEFFLRIQKRSILQKILLHWQKK